MERGTIVVIDDELSVREVVRAYLERDGFAVRVADSGRDGLTLVLRAAPSLVVLDLMLPDVGGEEICRQLRRRSDVPILMLTAKASEDERVSGLALGADDYLTKPFSPRELVARVRAVLRRSQGGDVPLLERIDLDDGRLVIDTHERSVIRDGRPLDLTPSEYRLLVALARYPGRVYSRFELLTAVQGEEALSDERVIDVHIKNVRKKLEPNPKEPRYLETVFGAGYRLAKL
ncbi:MAG: response regulator transcription factor [Gaiellales bacterium]